MNRKITALTILCAMMSSPLYGASILHRSSSNEDVGTAIHAVLAAQDSAWNRGDIDGFMAGYARNNGTLFISGDSVTRGWQTVHDRYRKKYNTRAKMGTLSFSDLEIRKISGDAALAIGTWSLQRAGDRPHGKFTLLFRRLPEGWRIVLDHTSAAAAP
jgi:ketosteroid isomerase-like protein